MDTVFANGLRTLLLFLMAVAVATAACPAQDNRAVEYPDVILDTRLEADTFSGRSLQAVFEKMDGCSICWIYGI